MKTARILCVVIGCGSLAFGRSFAEEASKSPAKESQQHHSIGIHSAEAARGETDRIHSPLNNKGRLSERSSQAGSLHVPPKSPSFTQLHPLAFKRTAPFASGGWMTKKPVSYHELLAKLPSGRETALPVSGLAHGRSTVAESIGGPTTTLARNTVTGLNGSNLKRKP